MIGTCECCGATVEADTREAANLKLYDDFDHVQTLVMTPIYEQSEVEDAVRFLEEETETRDAMKEPKINMETLRTALTIMEESTGDGFNMVRKGKVRLAVLNAVEDAAEFEKIERSLRAINERQCNGYCNERTGREDEAGKLRDERREAKLRDKALDLAKRLGLDVWFNGDPRGSAVKIHTPKTGAYNSFGGAEDGWCV